MSSVMTYQCPSTVCVMSSMVAGVSGLSAIPLPNRRDWRRLRMAARWTLADMADACGVTERTVGRWERDEAEPTGKKAQRYAAVLARIQQDIRKAENNGSL